MTTTTPPPNEDAESSAWQLPLGACVLALATMPLLGVERGTLVVGSCAAVGLVAIASNRARVGRRRVLSAELRSPWFLCLSSVVVFDLAVLRSLERLVVAEVLLGASVVFTAGVCVLAWERLRGLAVELVVEALIGTGGLGLLAYALLVDPWLTATDDAATAAVAFTALGVVTGAVYIYCWLVTIDHEARCGSSTLLALCGVVLAVASGVVLHDAVRPPAPSGIWPALAVAATCTVAASAAHPSQRLLRSPALMVQAARVGHRALMAVSAVLVGPFLIIIDLVTPFGLWLGLTAMGSGVLSVVVSAHVFRLLRKCGALEHDVHHDSLTGLPNRMYFNSRLDLAIDLARGERRTLAVMFLDLDRFKNVNDSLGHAAGNTLLVQVARRLSGAVDRGVTVARLAGDEFAILIPAVANYKHTEAIAKAMLAAFAEPFELGRRRLYMTPSIGVAHYPTDGLLASDLLEHADAAMYRAKERGRNTVELYSGAGRAQAVNRLDLESALHNAVDENQLELYFQPKVNVLTGRVVGVEALLRWDHPILGPIPPDEFIPLAEESGLISMIGEWTLIEGCTRARAWMDQGIDDVTMAINLSPRQFELQRVQDLVARVLRFTRLPPHLLELELTENLALKDPAGVAAVIADLHAMGVRCAIDDFGVGYSGLGYLAQFSFDAIKIDRKFVDGIDATGAPIVTAVIAMAKGLDIDVVAEGVETAEQLEFLRRNGCEIMQGFYFSRPLPAHALEPILRRVLESPGSALVRSLSGNR